ncbi:MAG: lipase maturation factor family protein, partial [Acidobacteriota bacterium]
RWKPGDVHRRPPLAAPHMPRLDWQMWFAALGSARTTRWFSPFLLRLLEGSPEVLDLMGDNPFPDRPPRFIRARLFDYTFTRRADPDATGAWWHRRLLGTYTPPVRLRSP